MRYCRRQWSIFGAFRLPRACDVLVSKRIYMGRLLTDLSVVAQVWHKNTLFLGVLAHKTPTQRLDKATSSPHHSRVELPCKRADSFSRYDISRTSSSSQQYYQAPILARQTSYAGPYSLWHKLTARNASLAASRQQQAPLNLPFWRPAPLWRPARKGELKQISSASRSVPKRGFTWLALSLWLFPEQRGLCLGITSIW